MSDSRFLKNPPFHKSYDVKCLIVFFGNFAEMAALEALQNVNICAILNFTGINEKVDLGHCWHNFAGIVIRGSGLTKI